MCTAGVKLSGCPLYVTDYVRRTDSGEIFMNQDLALQLYGSTDSRIAPAAFFVESMVPCT